MAQRHPILYDVERWRRYRTWLLLPATVFVMTAIFVNVLKPQAGAALGYLVVAVALLAVASSIWTRQHFSYLARSDATLVVRAMAASHRLGAADIDRVRVVKLGSVFQRPERRHLLPRPAERWLSTPALSISLRDGVDTRGLTRILGARGVIDGALVVPVDDAEGLLAELLEHVCPPPQAVSRTAPRRRGRRR